MGRGRRREGGEGRASQPLKIRPLVSSSVPGTRESAQGSHRWQLGRPCSRLLSYGESCASWGSSGAVRRVPRGCQRKHGLHHFHASSHFASVWSLSPRGCASALPHPVRRAGGGVSRQRFHFRHLPARLRQFRRRGAGSSAVALLRAAWLCLCSASYGVYTS